MIEHLIWDSNFLGYKVGKITSSSGSLLNFLSNETYGSSEFKLIYIFTKSEFTTVDLDEIDWSINYKDTRLVYRKDISNLPKILANSYIVSTLVKSNVLIKLAIGSGVESRFKKDTKFPNGKFEELYSLWLEKSLKERDSEVLTYIDDHIKGFVSWSKKGTAGVIDLISVDPRYRGQKIASKLILEFERRAKDKGCSELSVATQQVNVAAQNLYVKLGFKLESTTYIYHLWNDRSIGH